MNRLYETMTRVKVGGYVVRVWRSSPQFSMGPDRQVLTALRLADSPVSIVRVLDSMAGIEAYEILDKSGQGGITYPDWR